MPIPDIVIANGFDRFHLLNAAAEVHRHGRLDYCFAGFYPDDAWRARLATFSLGRHPRAQRLLDRAVALPSERLLAMPAIEAFGSLGGGMFGDHAIIAARHAFARKVAARLAGRRATLFHYRSGFGHAAAAAARAAGMITVCDHSIAHPRALEHLIQHEGRMPAAGEPVALRRRWADVAADFDGADAVLVCSDFVKETFVNEGWDPELVHVAYLGVDDGFFERLDSLPPRPEPAPGERPLRLMFCGAIERRKGVDALAAALAGLDDVAWTLDLVGPVDPEMAAAHGAFFNDPRVTMPGVLRRRELARHMLQADLFLFPTLAEGSARVLFEALACGCYLVTTPNGGSVAKDGVHGDLVRPGDVAAIQDALRRAAAEPGRIAAIGRRNAQEVRAQWRQRHYGESLIALYDQLLDERRARAAQAA